MMNYFEKMKGQGKSPPQVGVSEMIWSWFGAFVGVSAVAYIHFHFLSGSDLILIIGSLGASAVLIFGAVRSPLAQPRNLIGGHFISAVIGVTAYKLLPSQLWIASASAVATSILMMHLTKTLHPPGGATALIAVIGGSQIHDLGYLYAVVPAGLGPIIMLIAALVINNIPKHRRYPEYWL